MTREEMTRQLDVLKSHGRVVLSVGVPLVVLFEISIIFWFLRVQHAQPHSRRTAYLGLLGMAVYSAVVGALYLALRRNVAKYAPLCPLCAKPISWRERDAALNSGACPHCKGHIFLPRDQTQSAR